MFAVNEADDLVIPDPGEFVALKDPLARPHGGKAGFDGRVS